MSRRKNWTLNIIGILLVLIFLFPVYWMIITAFKTQSEIFQTPPTFWPEDFQLKSFKDIFKDHVGKYFLNSFIISGLATILVLILAVPSAYGLARFKIKWKNSMILLFLVTQMLPATVILTPLFIVFNNLSLLNSYWGPVLTTATLGVPFSVLILRTFF